MLVAFQSVLLLLVARQAQSAGTSRSKRWLIFTPSTQFGALLTVSTPLEGLAQVSFAYFFEANYYNIANSSYLGPILGDETVLTVGRRNHREATELNSEEEKDNEIETRPERGGLVTRSRIYGSLERAFKGRGLHGRQCLLRAICENAVDHFHHNGLLGDLLHIVLTPSSSQSEEAVSDEHYLAELRGRSGAGCRDYHRLCPRSVLDLISLVAT